MKNSYFVFSPHSRDIFKAVVTYFTAEEDITKYLPVPVLFLLGDSHVSSSKSRPSLCSNPGWENLVSAEKQTNHKAHYR